ncbi:uncharacterized protein txlnba isoform 1-T1 [Pholidichthys leucotaenia]
MDDVTRCPSVRRRICINNNADHVSRSLRMEASVKAAEVLVHPQPDVEHSVDPESCEEEVTGAAGACCSSTSSSSDVFDPMEEFSCRLEEILQTYGSTAELQDRQAVVESEMDKLKEEAKSDVTGAMETEVSIIRQSLSRLSTPEEKLEDLVKKYAELVAQKCSHEQKLGSLQRLLSLLMEERRQLHTERCSGIAARSKLESLCRDLQSHYNLLRDEMIRRCREDEEKRKEITTHFQDMLTEIQSQIEQHSTRNDKLCQENANLTDKLESLITHCERREESLEKINKHRELQHKLVEAKLQQANALLTEAEERHKREKEYLLVQAAEWKLQAQTLREQGTVMQAQLTLYAEKFDEFQATLAKSNEIYARFKREMENMSDRMKKMEKESNLWKTRFENCNKALTDMIEERAEKSQEYDLFVLKIQKLEKLCRALQDERKVLYEKIKDVHRSNSELPSKLFTSSNLDPQTVEKSVLLASEELQELHEEHPVLTEDMTRLKEEQARLQEFATCLLTVPVDNDEEDDTELDLEEDLVSTAFTHFKTKTQGKEDVELVHEKVEGVKPETGESDLSQQSSALLKQQDPTAKETTQTDQIPEAINTQTVEIEKVQQLKVKQVLQVKTEQTEQVKVKEVEQVKTEEVQQVKTEAVQQVKTEKVEEVKTEEVQQVETGKVDEIKSKKVEQVKAKEVDSVETKEVDPVKTKDVEQVKTKEIEPVIAKEVQQVKTKEVQQVRIEKVEEIKTNTVEQVKAEEVEPVKIEVDEKLKTEDVQQVKTEEMQQIKPIDEVQQQQQPVLTVSSSESEKVKVDTPKNSETTKAEILEEMDEVKPAVTLEVEKIQHLQAEPIHAPEESPETSKSTPLSGSTPEAAASPDSDSSKKQAPKKKKKRSGKSAS